MNQFLKSLLPFFLLLTSFGLTAQEAHVFVNRDKIFTQGILDLNRETIEHELAQTLLLVNRYLSDQAQKDFELRYEILAGKANAVYIDAARKIAAGWILDGNPFKKFPELEVRLDKVTALGLHLQKEMEEALYTANKKDEVIAHKGNTISVEVAATFALVWKLVVDINEKVTCKRAQKLYLASYWPPLTDIYNPASLTPINWNTVVDVSCAEKIQKWDAKADGKRD